MFCQYPENTEGVYSYIEARGNGNEKIIVFGLQAFIKEYLLQPITMADIDEAEAILLKHCGVFNRSGWEYILKHHNGFMPVTIKAVPEGMRVPTGMPMLVIENTDEKCFWLTTYLETALLRAIWYGSSVATNSRKIKDNIKKFLELSGDSNGIDFKLHDFGKRGVSSFESSGIGGAAHLINFKGTDTISAIVFANTYYNSGVCGYSIPAMEHSTVTSWGEENEVNAYRNMLEKFAKPNAVIACVSDSYDIFNAASKIWGEELKEEVKDSGAVVVIRPDSGDPVSVCTELVKILGEKFGYVVNEKGYKVLNNVRIIQGDGIDYNVIDNILSSFLISGWSAENIGFGMGGALLQHVNRDTYNFAMKCSAIKVNGKWRHVFKKPVTDNGKNSKKGRVTLYRERDGNFRNGVEDWETPVLVNVFENGKLLKEYSFEEVRNNSEI